MMTSQRRASIDRPRIEWTLADAKNTRAAIMGTSAPDWLDLKNEPTATLIKSNARRTVWHVKTTELDVHVKVFDKRGIRHPADSHAGSEAEYTHMSHQIGVPTPQLVGVGIARKKTILLLETIPNSMTLMNAWQSAASDKQAQKNLLGAVAELVGKAHRLGFIHYDNHPSNILVQATESGFKGFYIDIAKNCIAARQRLSQQKISLAQLVQWFRLRSTRSQRLRFLKMYLEHSQLGDGNDISIRRTATEIFRRANQHARKLWSKRDSRIFETNAYFVQIKLSNTRRAHVTLKTRDVPDLPSAGFVCVEKSEWNQHLTDASPAPDNVTAQTHPFNSAPAIRAPQNRSDAHAQFHAAHRILHRDVPTRRPIALIENKSATLWLDKTPETNTLESTLIAPNPQQRTESIRQIARTVRRMSERGIVLTSVTKESFSLPSDGKLAILERPTDVEFRNISFQRDRLDNARAFRRYFKSTNTIRSTDAIRFLKSFAPAHWKKIIHELRKSP